MGKRLKVDIKKAVSLSKLLKIRSFDKVKCNQLNIRLV